jgi:hypothetical protein
MMFPLPGLGNAQEVARRTNVERLKKKRYEMSTARSCRV